MYFNIVTYFSAHVDFIEKWHFCQLEVLACREVPWPSAGIERKNSIEGCGWPLQNVAYECKIKLLSGKTHQVISQGLYSQFEHFPPFLIHKLSF